MNIFRAKVIVYLLLDLRKNGANVLRVKPAGYHFKITLLRDNILYRIFTSSLGGQEIVLSNVNNPQADPRLDQGSRFHSLWLSLLWLLITLEYGFP
jgi:hypothetical protein